MATQTFTSGQVLTAAQMTTLQTNDYNQTVSNKTASYTLVAADVGTRIVMNSASATTITVNTSLFSAGDTLVLQNIGAGVCTVTAGTATVSSAGPLAIPQNGSGTLYFTSAGVSIFFPSAVTASASGLTLISSTTIGSAVSSVTVSSAFSATYDNYLIIISGGTASVSEVLTMKLGATTTGYYYKGFYGSYANNTVSGDGAQNAGSFGAVGVGSTNSLNAVITLTDPFSSKNTHFVAQASRSATDGLLMHYGGYLADTTSYTAFTIGATSGTLTGGTIRVYGYKNS